MLYFIRSGQYVKIGVAKNPWSRLVGFQIASPDRLELLAVAPGGFKEEQRVQREFASYHYRGEWYEYKGDVKRLIEFYREEFPDLQQRPVFRDAAQNGVRDDYKSTPTNITPVDAVRLVVNTAVAMADNEPAIDVRSVTESRRGPGILIWIPGYVSNGDTIIVASAGMREGAAVTEAATPAPQEEQQL